MDGMPLTYILPSLKIEGILSVEEAISRRRSRRSFSGEMIQAEEVSQILWAAYGFPRPVKSASPEGSAFRTAPSAGATYPLELYLLAGKVRGIEPGVYRYIPRDHKMIRVIDDDIKPELSVAALNQEMIRDAPACLFFSAVFSRTTRIYGERGSRRYVCMDLGHSAQNVYLQAEALQLGTCAIGAFHDSRVRAVMQLPEEEEPLYIMPIGKTHA